ncbi:hypothetical protein [Dyella flagellata]|nr:hypothetical protein [Dyella flagellata]
MSDVSLFRLYLLRATYLLLVVGLGTQIWPDIIEHTRDATVLGSDKYGVVHALLAAVSVLALLGLRYPLQMLPLLFFEMVWKSTWLLAFALPFSLAHQVDAHLAETINACLMGVIFPIVIPWGYVWTNYVKKPGDRWGMGNRGGTLRSITSHHS